MLLLGTFSLWGVLTFVCLWFRHSWMSFNTNTRRLPSMAFGCFFVRVRLKSCHIHCKASQASQWRVDWRSRGWRKGHTVAMCSKLTNEDDDDDDEASDVTAKRARRPQIDRRLSQQWQKARSLTLILTHRTESGPKPSSSSSSRHFLTSARSGCGNALQWMCFLFTILRQGEDGSNQSSLCWGGSSCAVAQPGATEMDHQEPVWHFINYFCFVLYGAHGSSYRIFWCSDILLQITIYLVIKIFSELTIILYCIGCL